jgi:hypothetical protein
MKTNHRCIFASCFLIAILVPISHFGCPTRLLDMHNFKMVNSLKHRDFITENSYLFESCIYICCYVLWQLGKPCTDVIVICYIDSLRIFKCCMKKFSVYCRVHINGEISADVFPRCEGKILKLHTSRQVWRTITDRVQVVFSFSFVCCRWGFLKQKCISKSRSSVFII